MATQDLFEFNWAVDNDGYEVGESDGQPGVLVIRGKGGPVGGYRFSKIHDGLFRRFAALPLNADSIVTFANEYGLLYQPSANWELYSDWIGAIQEMSALASAIDDGRNKDVWSLFNSGRISPIFHARIRPNELLPKKSEFLLQPASLMSAMWLQIADQSTKGTSFKQCAMCPTWFPYGPGTGVKPSKVSCSGKCRQALKRKKAKENQNAG